jgi:hypothetical protein
MTYTEFGHNSFRKLVCINPGSRHPTVLAGAPAYTFDKVNLLPIEKKQSKRF